jgi:hypothetical protein
MNRHQRRAGSAAKRRDAGSVFEYRVPPGMVAMTFDIVGLPPSTTAIRVESLVDVVDGIDRQIMTGRTYEQGLSLFVAAFRKAKGGNAEAYSICLLGYWLALNHPHAGPQMRELVADAIATSNHAHLTFFIARGGTGIAFAVAGAFVDLEPVRRAMPRNAVTLIVQEPRPRRPGGEA